MQTITAALAPDHLETVYSNVLILGPGATLRYSAAYGAGSANRVALEITSGPGGFWNEVASATFTSSSQNYSGTHKNTHTKPLSVRFKATNTVDATNDSATITIKSFEQEIVSVLASTNLIEKFFSLQHDAVSAIYDAIYVDVASLTSYGKKFVVDVTDVAATSVYGLQVNLTQGASGSITTKGFAVDAQVSINVSGSADGTLAPIRAAFYSDSAVSDPAGADAIAYAYFENAGNATGGLDIDTDVNLFHVVGHTIANGNLVEAVGTAYALSELTHSIRIKIGSTLYYVPISTIPAHST